MVVPNSKYFLLNPRGLLWSEVQGKDIVMVDEYGTAVCGVHEVESTAMNIHGAIHRIANKNCVMHTHMPYSTSLTLLEGIPFETKLSQNAMRYHGRVGKDCNYNGLAVDATEGERIARSMAKPGSEGREHFDIGFLGNHGIVVCGDRIDHAYVDLYYLERACQAQWLAMSTGQPLRICSDEVTAVVAQQMLDDLYQSELFFNALRRKF